MISGSHKNTCYTEKLLSPQKEMDSYEFLGNLMKRNEKTPTSQGSCPQGIHHTFPNHLATIQ